MKELTYNQLDILAALIEGKKIKEIATMKEVTPGCVSITLIKIREDLKVKNNIQACIWYDRRYIHKNGWHIERKNQAMKGNGVKYVVRNKNKISLKDLIKAKTYINRFIECMKGGESQNG